MIMTQKSKAEIITNIILDYKRLLFEDMERNFTLGSIEAEKKLSEIFDKHIDIERVSEWVGKYISDFKAMTDDEKLMLKNYYK